MMLGGLDYNNLVEIIRALLVGITVISWAILFRISSKVDKLGYTLMSLVILYVILSQ